MNLEDQIFSMRDNKESIERIASAVGLSPGEVQRFLAVGSTMSKKNETKFTVWTRELTEQCKKMWESGVPTCEIVKKLKLKTIKQVQSKSLREEWSSKNR